MLSKDQNQSNIVRQAGLVNIKDRCVLLNQKPLTIWLTGLSGAGKSTLAFHLEKALITEGFACYVLDGDNVRHGLNQDLGFTHKDRTENIRRVAEVARLMNDAGLIVITAFISPIERDRSQARAVIGDASFFEVYVSTALEECERRDPKNLYKKARKGELDEFTGISSPYEIPESPDMDVDTQENSIEDCTLLLTERVIKLCGGVANHGK